ncbi:flagellar basal body P-ring formation chaperone FlgA [Salipiger sp. PrR003]|uniref:flagellar basal body P-ring formation chaperone FlgA n=1 Tax=Salipiger sp. PrR003 TaxID=2706776 RepID=UPI0013DB0B86|nr:flagellar basal body P-ring formation chaperone FlgA [Salipiger sp. PrR003]NDV50768.1 flagellar basal body P-ring formation protein FlgA [Salipiger sp. PrR003]
MSWIARIFAGAICALGTVAPAAAVTVTELVEERAMEQTGRDIPAGARYSVRLAGSEDADAVVINDWWLDPISGQFLANVVMESGVVQRVGGVVIVTMDVPVPTHRIAAGEILSEGDLEIRSLPSGRVGSYAVLDRNDLIGMQVQRVLMRGRPVQKQSISPPIIIDRGEIVTISYENDGLALTAKGKALASGYKGQDIRVVNLVSNKTLVGVASQEGLVEVIR